MDQLRFSTVTITGGGSLSGACSIPEGARPIAVITDAAWDTQAMTFQACVDGTNYFNLYNEGTEYSLAGVVASHFHRIDLNMFLGVRKIKVRSGTGGAPANQGDDTVLTVVFWVVD